MITKENKKGCGNEYLNMRDSQDILICGVGWRCPSCSNQSPQNSEGGNNSSESLDSNRKINSGDDTSLSDKSGSNGTFEYFIKEDVKDFIEKLKEESDEFPTRVMSDGIFIRVDKIDSLAGDKLI